MNWYSLDLEKIKDILKTDFYNGLSEKEALSRLHRYGPNKIQEFKPESKFKIFLSQFQSPLIYILFFAAFIVYLIGNIKDSLIILFVLLFNATIGTIHELKAQNTLLALRRFLETKTTVIRNSIETIIDSSEVVVGDIILLKEGEKVPADARLVEAYNLKIDESSLTGESVPVHKSEKIIEKENLGITEQFNMIFMGTNVVAGWGKAVVVATGLNSFMGKISQKIFSIDTEIPLKKDLRYFSRLLILVILILILILFIFGILIGKSVYEMFATLVALAVSIVPEGLPVLLTLVLAIGVLKMAHKNALVKKLAAVESLSQVKVIAVDKTGTLTKNELIIRFVFINNNFFEIGGSGYEPFGELKFKNKVIDSNNFPELILAGQIASFCSNATLKFQEDKKIWQISGDPTDAALLVLGHKLGFSREYIESNFAIINEIPFDYKNKYHAVCRKFENQNFISIVGAPEKILELSSKIYVNGKAKKISLKEKEKLNKIFEDFSEKGFRVVAFGYKTSKKSQIDVSQIIFGGFYFIEDSLRPEVKNAVTKVKEAGIKVVMITGDHKKTAQAIAYEAGILEEGSKILTGEEINKMSDDALSQIILDISVFARVTPDHKLKIIEAYRKKGIIVAMTGDGVNDAPSLVAADLGVAMGRVGTEVAKEAADIVLLDDNFGTIVDAVEEGRLMYKKIQKIILFLISTSVGEIISISLTIFLGLPILLLPAQILWLNLVTDPFIALPLAFEDEKGILKRKFQRSKYLIDRLMIYRTLLIGTTMAFGSLYVFNLIYEFNLDRARTLTLLTLAIYQWFNGFNCRFEYRSAFYNLKANKFLFLALGAVVLLQICAIYLPFMQSILNTVPLSFFEWLLAIIVSFSIILVEETRKFFALKFKNNEVSN